MSFVKQKFERRDIEKRKKYLLEHLDRAMELLNELQEMLEKDVEDWLSLVVLRSTMLAHVEMIKGRVGRARYHARQLIGGDTS